MQKQMWRRTALAVAVGMACSGGVGAYTVSGSIHDSDGTTGLLGVAVTILNDSLGVVCNATTDNVGSFSCANVGSGSYRLLVSRQGYAFPDGLTVSVTTDIADENISALPAHTVSGTLKNPDGSPIANAWVYKKLTSGMITSLAQTDAQGQFSFAIEDGFHATISFGLISSTGTYGDVDYSAAPITADQTLNFVRWPQISGIIKDASETPLAGVAILLGSSSCATSDSNGAYQCAVAPGYSGSLAFRKNGYIFTGLSVSNVTTDQTGKDVSAQTTHTISGSVRDSAGNGVSGVAVLSLATGTSLADGCGTSDSSGDFTCLVPQNFTGTLYFSKNGHAFPNTQISTPVTNDNLVLSVQEPVLRQLAITVSSGGASPVPMSGVTVCRYDSAAKSAALGCGATDSNGQLTYGVPENFSGVLAFYKTGWLFADKNYSQTPVTANATVSVAARDVPRVTGSVSSNGSPVQGARVDWSPNFSASNFSSLISCTDSDSSGAYACAVDAAQIPAPANNQTPKLKINPVLGGYLFTPVDLTAASFSGGSVSNLNFTADPTAKVLSGQLQALPGGSLTYGSISFTADGSRSLEKCENTTSTGQFACAVPNGFTGKLLIDVSASQAGYAFPDQIFSNVAANQSGLTIAAVPLRTISGRFMKGSNGVAGATVFYKRTEFNYKGCSSAVMTTTDSNGYFSCAVPEGYTGDLFFAATETGAVFHPITQPVGSNGLQNVLVSVAASNSGNGGSTTPPPADPLPPTTVTLPAALTNTIDTSAVTLKPVSSVNSVFADVNNSAVTVRGGAVAIDTEALGKDAGPLVLSGNVPTGTPIVLTAAPGVEAKPVTVNVGGQNVTITTPPGSSTLLTTATVQVNGQAQQVLVVTSGTASLAATTAGQVVGAVTLPGSSTPVVLTSNADNAAASVSSSKNGAVIAATKGAVTVTISGFVSGFAADDGATTLKIYAGEKVSLNPAGLVTAITLATDSGKAAGDPLTLPPGSPITATVPVLDAPVERLGGKTLLQAIAAAVGSSDTARQSAQGVVTLGSATALPVGSVTVNPGRTDGLVLGADGLAAVTKDGVTVKFAPAVADPDSLLVALTGLAPVTGAKVGASGTWTITVGGSDYAVRPSWTGVASGLDAGFTTGSAGSLTYTDAKGVGTTLAPAFLDPALAQQIVADALPTATVTVNADGSLALKTAEAAFTLVPEMTVAPLNESAITRVLSGKRWWMENGKVFLLLNGKVQGVVVH